jgi:hypothetical protein
MGSGIRGCILDRHVPLLLARAFCCAVGVRHGLLPCPAGLPALPLDMPIIRSTEHRCSHAVRRRLVPSWAGWRHCGPSCAHRAHSVRPGAGISVACGGIAGKGPRRLQTLTLTGGLHFWRFARWCGSQDTVSLVLSCSPRVLSLMRRFLAVCVCMVCSVRAGGACKLLLPSGCHDNHGSRQCVPARRAQLHRAARGGWYVHAVWLRCRARSTPVDTHSSLAAAAGGLTLPQSHTFE